MNTSKQLYFWMVFCFIAFAGLKTQAATVNYSLDNITMAGGRQMTGAFSWTFDIGDFENGVGQFTSLVIPWTNHNQDDLNATFDIGSSIEITLEGSVHDDGVDISLFVLEPLTPTTSSALDLVRSKYEIGGNGFHDGQFLSGSISLVHGDIFPSPEGDGWIDGDDLGLLLANWGTVVAPNAADLFPIPDGNGLVDGDDLGLLLANWTGSPPAMVGDQAAVPGPATALPALFGLMALASAVRRRQ